VPAATSALIRRGVGWLRELQRRYDAIAGPTLAGGVTLYGFLALFALLVLAVAVLGFVSADNSHLAQDITHDLGLTGDAAKIVTDSVTAAQHSRRLTTAVGIVGILWLGSSFALVVANAFDAAWHVPGRGWRDRVRGLGWLLGAGVLVVAALEATSLWAVLPDVFAPLVLVTSLAANALIWMWTSWLLPNRPSVGWRVLVVPALLAAIALEVLKVVGTYVVPRYVETSSELYGAIGVVFAILLWLLILGRVVVYVAVLEAWRAERASLPAQLE
jgi:membrane protein